MTEDVLAVADKHPDQFIPFFSINPRRADALDQIDEYTERGCRGAKFLQNYWGVDLNDQQFIPYYEKLKSLNIPLIIHKLLFGTDYPVPFAIRYNSDDLSASRRKEINNISNPFDRYTAALLEYFPADNPVYSNYQKVLHLQDM